MVAAEIYRVIPKIMAEVGAIEKGRNNKQQDYRFRGIDDVYFALQPLLAKHGVFYAPRVTKESRTEKSSRNGGTLFYTILTMDFTFYAVDGSSFVCTTVGEAMDSGDKSTNKAMSAALKYALLQVFCIPTEEPKDSENDSPEVSNGVRDPGPRQHGPTASRPSPKGGGIKPKTEPAPKGGDPNPTASPKAGIAGKAEWAHVMKVAEGKGVTRTQISQFIGNRFGYKASELTMPDYQELVVGLIAAQPGQPFGFDPNFDK